MEAFTEPVEETIVGDTEVHEPAVPDVEPTSAGLVIGTVLIFVAAIVGGMVLARERRWDQSPRQGATHRPPGQAGG